MVKTIVCMCTHIVAAEIICFNEESVWNSSRSWSEWPRPVNSGAMAFFRNLKSFFTGESKPKRPKILDVIKKGQDPSEIWEIIGEIGDGAFGKVYKVSHMSAVKSSSKQTIWVTSRCSEMSWNLLLRTTWECRWFKFYASGMKRKSVWCKLVKRRFNYWR